MKPAVKKDLLRREVEGSLEEQSEYWMRPLVQCRIVEEIFKSGNKQQMFCMEECRAD